MKTIKSLITKKYRNHPTEIATLCDKITGKEAAKTTKRGRW